MYENIHKNTVENEEDDGRRICSTMPLMLLIEITEAKSEFICCFLNLFVL